jgi:hypothetical protein
VQGASARDHWQAAPGAQHCPDTIDILFLFVDGKKICVVNRIKLVMQWKLVL